MYRGGFSKYDANGNLVMSKIFSIGPNLGQDRFFQSCFFTLIQSNEIIMNGRVRPINVFEKRLFN